MAEAPYLRIAAEIRGRIERGELAAGSRIPSTRQIMRDWGVAMATATKAITVLRHEGLVRTAPGSGTVVRVRPVHPIEAAEPRLSRERVVHRAVQIADNEGLPALTMRRLASELGVTAMSLYRHISGKDELVLLMYDAVFGSVPLPSDPPDGWRPRLELAARRQWAIHRRHLWTTQVISYRRPVMAPHAIKHTEWMMAALDGLGLDTTTIVRIVMGVSAYVQGMAVGLTVETEAEIETGMSTAQWWDAIGESIDQTLSSGSFPMLSRLDDVTDIIDLDTNFEFGLLRHLDGIAVYLERPR